MIPNLTSVFHWASQIFSIPGENTARMLHMSIRKLENFTRRLLSRKFSRLQSGRLTDTIIFLSIKCSLAGCWHIWDQTINSQTQQLRRERALAAWPKVPLQTFWSFYYLCNVKSPEVPHMLTYVHKCRRRFWILWICPKECMMGS